MAVVMTIILDGDKCWPDLDVEGDTLFSKVSGKPVIHLDASSPPIQVAALDGGMESGKASVTIRLDLPDGTVVLAETSMALFFMATVAFRARFGNQGIEAL